MLLQPSSFVPMGHLWWQNGHFWVFIEVIVLEKIQVVYHLWWVTADLDRCGMHTPTPKIWGGPKGVKYGLSPLLTDGDKQPQNAFHDYPRKWLIIWTLYNTEYVGLLIWLSHMEPYWHTFTHKTKETTWHQPESIYIKWAPKGQGMWLRRERSNQSQRLTSSPLQNLTKELSQ